MVDAQTEIIINQPIEKVADYAQNPDNATKWYANIMSSQLLTPKPLRVGSRIAFEAGFLGRRPKYTYEVVDLVPWQKLVMRTSDGPFSMETTYEWEAIDKSRTLMKLRNSGNPTGFSKLMAPFMAIAMRRANNQDLSQIKELLEK